MKKLILLTLLSLATTPCFALLSPLNQSLEEIQSVLHSPELQKFFPQSESLVEIRRAQNGYMLSTLSVQVMAEIVYVPKQRPGKQQFNVVFHEPTPIR